MRLLNRNLPRHTYLLVIALGCGLLMVGGLVCGFVGTWLLWSGTTRIHTNMDWALATEHPSTPVILRTPSPFPSATHVIASPSDPSWTNQVEEAIVFTCFIDGSDEICRMNTDGSDQQRLTDDPATDFYSSLAPDGKSIMFSSRRDGRFEIYSMDLSGGDLVRLTDGLGDLFAPDISPDGQRIILTNAHEGRQSIWIMNRDGSNTQALTDGPWEDLDPTWSPDGRQIAFASTRNGSRQLYIMDADGSNVRKVTPDLPNMGGRNDWSPDGRNLVFYAGSKLEHNIYIIDLNGSNLRQLTDGGDNLGPSFSHDGQWIAFTSFRDGNNEIYIMHPDGSEVIRLTYNTRSDWQPRW